LVASREREGARNAGRPGAVTREASVGSWADRSPSPAIINAIVWWLRRALADAARAWALAAGVPPDLYS
jgi:hypothetical protein